MRGDHGKLMADLNLTDAQKNQIKAIHTKYEPQFKALRDQGKSQFGSWKDARQKGDTSAAARAKFKEQREAFRTRSMAIRQQEQNEVRGILTVDQRTKWDAAQAQRKTRMEARMKQMKDRAALKKSGKA
jgi:Spy/CpxP family protein refolding chaperone